MNAPEPTTNPDPKPRQASSGNAAWLIPPGVSKGNWDYVRAKQIAGQYDEFLNLDPLTEVDWQIIDRYLPDLKKTNQMPSPIVADFGCGTGRTLLPLLKRGYRGLGVDLSIPMLDEFLAKTNQISSENSDQANSSPLQQSKSLQLINANLVELDGLKDNSIDHAVCMFSTLGMIQGSKNRAAFLAHVRRMLKPGGQFIIHAHNVWFQLRHPGGVSWAVKNGWSHFRKRSEFGDRTANYRGLNNMYIHSFRKNEFRGTLQDNGFKEQTWFGISPGKSDPLERLPFASSLRLVGWIVVCR